MGVSALRVAACAGLLIGALVLGDSAAGPAFADPVEASPSQSDEPSKTVDKPHASLAHVIQRILSEHRRRIRHDAQRRPKVKIGSEPDTLVLVGDSAMSTFADADTEQPPQADPDIQRDSDPAATNVDLAANGADGGSGTDPGDGTQTDGTVQPSQAAIAPADDTGSDYIDNAAAAAPPAVPKTPDLVAELRYPLYWWELRRREGGDWWNVEQLMSSFQQVISPLLPSAARKPEPEPTPTIGPAFRGGAPEPEPVLDASGGVVGGGSDYQATGFAGAPVLTAPIIAVPAPPPAAARFPAIPPAAPPPPGVGSAVARFATPEPGSAAQFSGRTAPQQAQSRAVEPMSGQTPRRGYTDYLRRPGLPQLAGAALPGVAGIVLMTLAGGVLGYRQASAGRMIRASGAARYLP